MDANRRPTAPAPDKHLLLASQVVALNQTQQDALRFVATRFQLDAYTTRQRLLGGGLALIAQGEGERLHQVAAVLKGAGIDAWTLLPTRPRFAPAQVRGLERTSTGLVLKTHQSEIRLENDSHLVLLLADLSGKLAEKHLKRLLVQETYLGVKPQTHFSQDETRTFILVGQPVLDIYLLDSAGLVAASGRVLPGKFDPSGLGDRKSISSRGNFEALLDLLQEQVASIHLETSFGLSQIPRLNLQRAADGSDWQPENLRRLTRFGWLVTDLVRAQRAEAAGQPNCPSPGSVAVAALLGRPELAGADLDGVPGLGQLAREVDAAINETTPPYAAPPSAPPLPPPPEARQVRRDWRQLGPWLAGAGGLVLVGSIEMADFRLVRFFYEHGLANGLLPGAAAIGLFLAGFHYLRLQQRIATTPTSRIRSLAMGLVELHGTARRRYALVAPLSQMACVYYRLRKYRLEERNNQRHWRLVSDTDSGHVPFLLDDGTGTVTVDPFEARVTAGHTQEGYPGAGGILFGTSFAGDHSEKWIETSIPDGTQLYVLGTAMPVREETATLRDRTTDKLRELKQDAARMRRFDVDGDGRISEEEWQAAREAMEHEALQERLSATQEPAPAWQRTVICRGPHRSHPFVIAQTESEAALLRRYRWFGWPFLAVSLACGAWAVWRLLETFA